ncbi:uncharacterized protein LOC124193531 isoform X2 [Daphnia pulex]|uniref:uncharacterized protein LOC124193531 isoform X2 n=1 Tax=Daphnia pulex TaxID=6669 RepID=UPI001EDD33C6|nr:uncharacterized protein LOC124193531 isoform X2 [Daphnia pulex]
MATNRTEEDTFVELIKTFLKEFTEGKFSYNSNKDECEATLNMPTHLFAGLRTSQQERNDDLSLKSLKYLMENNQVSRQFTWNMLPTLLTKHKDSLCFYLLFQKLKDLLLQSQTVNELFLVNTVLLLLQEKKYGPALAESQKFTVNEPRASGYESQAAAASALLAGYKTTLDFPSFEENIQVLKEMKITLALMFAKHPWMIPTFLEAYTSILIKLNAHDEIELFLRGYVANDGGIASAILALEIMKVYIPNGTKGLNIHFLEKIAEIDQANPKVLDLCKLYLQSEFERDISQDRLKKCLKLMFDFLDAYAYRTPSDVVKEGWNVMANLMNKICLQGTDVCLEAVIKAWHHDRKGWWPFFRFSKFPSPLPSGYGEFLCDMATVCLILESQDHPFVVSVINLPECSSFQSVVSMHRLSVFPDVKMNFDSKINALITSIPLPILPPFALFSEPTRMEVSGDQTISGRASTDDTKQLALQFSNLLLKSKAIKKKTENKSCAKIRRATTANLKKPIEELIVVKTAPRSKRRKNQRRKKHQHAKTCRRKGECFEESWQKS